MKKVLEDISILPKKTTSLITCTNLNSVRSDGNVSTNENVINGDNEILLDENISTNENVIKEENEILLDEDISTNENVIKEDDEILLDENKIKISSLSQKDNVEDIDNVIDQAQSLQLTFEEKSRIEFRLATIGDTYERLNNNKHNSFTLLDNLLIKDSIIEDNIKLCSKRNQRKTRRKQQKEKALQKNNENYYDYLSDKEENSKIPQESECSKINFECREAMYAMIDTLSLNIYFSLCKDDRMYYCITCNKKISIEENNKLSEEFANHIKYSDTHKKLLSQMVNNDINCLKDGKPFSILGLAREHMILDENKNVVCLLCEGKNSPNKVNNDDQAIAEHIISNNHQNWKKSWSSSVKEDLQTIHKLFSNKKYSARKYLCEFCSYESPLESNFIKHLGVFYHRRRLAELYKAICNSTFAHDLQFNFYYCYTCQYLWFGNSQAFKYHYETLEHKNRIVYGGILGKVPKRVSNILLKAEQKAEALLEQSNYESYNEMIHNMVCSIEVQLQWNFPNLRAYPFGSRISDLALPGSDIDIFLDCDHMYEGRNLSHRDPKNLILEIASLLSSNSQVWKVQNIVLNTKIPIAKVYNIPLRLMCDISVTNGLAVENTKLIGFFNQAFPCGRKMILFLKQWLGYSNLSGSYKITNYALTWCVIFYLQKLLVFPSISGLINLSNKSWKIDGWEVGVSYNFHVRTPNFTFEELLMGFFIFYAEFNYEYIICPLLGKPLKQNEFDLKKLAPHCSEQFPITSLSIQDPFELSRNLTKGISKTELKRFQEYCYYSAQIIKNQLPSVNPLLLSYFSSSTEV
ncbi:uncharacterized protein LOC109851711 [Pseudomyrmex gracilis]|uniref:uncharacterized protein LOC109851711 n=1 Tax=Pseudomyrmex gracilis TaxID=219809 RepID=UPI000994C7D2|nr:uncharacterized protein LOC109851711 [Pseudomyrmex gracilis]